MENCEELAAGAAARRREPRDRTQSRSSHACPVLSSADCFDLTATKYCAGLRRCTETAQNLRGHNPKVIPNPTKISSLQVLANMSANAKNQERSSKKPRVVTEKQKKARAQNMRDYRASVGGATNLKHGVRLAIASGGKELPAIPEASEIRENVQSLLDAMVSDLGGETEITGSQKAILESQRLCLTILALGARYLSAEGIVDRKSRKPQGLLAVLGVYMNGLRLNSLALGLERKSRDARTLTQKLADIAEREHAEAGISDSEKSTDETP